MTSKSPTLGPSIAIRNSASSVVSSIRFLIISFNCENVLSTSAEYHTAYLCHCTYVGVHLQHNRICTKVLNYFTVLFELTVLKELSTATPFCKAFLWSI